MRTSSANAVARDALDRRLDEAEGFLMLRMPQHALRVLQARPLWATRQFRACLLMGRAMRQLGKCREAIKHLEIAAAILPDNPQVALDLAWCYKRTHQLAQAIDALDRAKQGAPRLARVRYNLACYWSLAGCRDRALDELRIAVELRPSYAFKAARDVDFAPIRDRAEFQSLTASPAPLQPS